MLTMRSMLAALALVSMASFSDAQASFTYSVAPNSTVNTFGGSSLTILAFNAGGNSAVLAGTQGINVAQISQTSTTVQPSTDTATISLPPLVVTINNQNGGGSGTFTVNGMINVTRSDTTGAASTFTPGVISPLTLVLGSFSYTLSTPAYSQPTIGAGGNGNGSLGYTITEASVPEPTSFALAGVGFAVVGALAWRRRQV